MSSLLLILPVHKDGEEREEKEEEVRWLKLYLWSKKLTPRLGLCGGLQCGMWFGVWGVE